MNEKILKISIIVLMTLILYFLTINLITSHEEGHKQINSMFGVESEIIYTNFYLDGQTIQTTYCDTTKYDCKDLLSAQAQHEAVGYNTVIGFIGIYIFLYTFIILKIAKVI